MLDLAMLDFDLVCYYFLGFSYSFFDFGAMVREREKESWTLYRYELRTEISN